MSFSILKHARLAGALLLSLDIFVWYNDWDIVRETLNGRSLTQINYFDLLLPIMLLIISIYLIAYKKNI
jgi:hypothetical protein